MEPINLASLSGRDLQNLDQILLSAENAGITSIDILRKQIQQYFQQIRLGNRLTKKKPVEKQINKRIKYKQKVEKHIAFSGIICPECKKSYLIIKTREGVIYTACPQCYKSVEFK